MLRDKRIVTSFLGFLLLGMPYSALGVAWPSVATDFGRSLGDLGVVLVITTIGYVAATAANGAVTHRMGTGVVLPAASALAAVAVLGFAMTTSWLTFLAAGFVLGIAGGSLDAGANAYVAVHGSTSAMGWLHAMFGVGATLAPFFTTELISRGGSWRTAFVVLAIAQAAVTVAFVATRRSWPAATARSRAAPRLPRTAWGIFIAAMATFALYTGVEVAAGEWTFSLFTEARGMSVRSAGYLVTGYWAMLTVGRVVMGLVGDRIARRSILIGSLFGSTAGLMLLWWAPFPAAGAAGLVVSGLFLAPIFPILMLIAADRIGAEYAARAVGYLIAAAGLGAAIIPGAIGAMVDRSGPGITAPITAGSALLLLAMGFIVAGPRRKNVEIDATSSSSA